MMVYVQVHAIIGAEHRHLQSQYGLRLHIAVALLDIPLTDKKRPVKKVYTYYYSNF